MPNAPTQTQRFTKGVAHLATIAAIAGLSVEPGDYVVNGPVQQITLTLKDVTLPITDVGSTGRFTQKLLDFPKGVINVLGATQKFTGAPTAGGNIQIATGTTADADGTLSGTEVNITAASTAAASDATSLRTSAPALFDGSATPVALHLNGVTAGDPSSGATIKINGKYIITFINTGPAA